MGSVYQPQRREGALDQITKVLQIGQAIYGLKNESAKSGALEAEARQKGLAADATSPESEGARQGYAELGMKVSPSDTMKSLGSRYGDLALLNQKKFEANLGETDKGGTFGAKEQAAFVQSGGALVPPGTKGSYTVPGIDANGKQVAMGLIPPPKTKPEVAVVAAKTPQDLNSSEKQRYDNVTMARAAVNEMNDALKSGQSVYSPIGDNDYTAALSRFTEALGRMQSGGAISKDENAHFSQLARSFGDSDEMRFKKLTSLANELDKRLDTLGVKASSPESKIAISSPSKKSSSDLVPNALANDLPEVRVIGNATYTKTKGGWKRM